MPSDVAEALSLVVSLRRNGLRKLSPGQLVAMSGIGTACERFGGMVVRLAVAVEPGADGSAAVLVRGHVEPIAETRVVQYRGFVTQADGAWTELREGAVFDRLEQAIEAESPLV
jgi:hypothetical protein